MNESFSFCTFELKSMKVYVVVLDLILQKTPKTKITINLEKTALKYIDKNN